MVQEKSNWVKGIEEELTKSFYKKIVWVIIFLLSIFALYFSKNISLILGITGGDIIGLILILLAIIALGGALASPKHPDYLAYYLYQIGYELPEFELEENFLKRNRRYIKNCSKQISNIIGAGEGDLRSKYFTDNIVDFLDKLSNIILRLNHIYNKEKVDEPFMNKRTDISSKLIELANHIYKKNSSLTPNHVDTANEIFNTLKDIPEKPFHKPLSVYVKERWDELPYKLRIVIFLVFVFISTFLIISRILIEYGQGQQSIAIAIGVSGVLTAAALNKIDLFIAHERVR